MIKLIVGLANPGKEYEDTRHNAGGWFVEAILAWIKTALRSQSKFHGLYSPAELGDHGFHLLIPTTYMNLSGQSVGACMRYLKLTPAEVLIAHDEIDLPPDTIKIKLGGGDGGHNGLKSVISHLHTKEFYRLRIGVGRPKQSEDVADYVLKKPSKADRQLILHNIQDAVDVLPLILQGEMQKAMHQLHSDPQRGES